MKRVLCLWFPLWPIQRRCAAEPELRGKPLVLVRRDSRRGCCVAEASPAARRMGMRPEMPLAEAQSLARHSPDALQVRDDDPVGDRQALRVLAEWCDTFSPLVGLEEGEQPSCLLLDIAGVGHLFGGLTALGEQVVAALQERGYWAWGAIAGTVAMAWAAAHYGWPAGSAVARLRQVPDDPRSVLGAMPPAALRLDAETLDLLQQLGIRCVAELERLPRAALAARLGDAPARRLDQAYGAMDELIVGHRASPRYTLRRDADFPTRDRTAVATWILQGVQGLCTELLRDGQGGLGWEVRFGARGVPPQRLAMELFQPAVCADHLRQLIAMHLEQTSSIAPVEYVEVTVTRPVRVAQRQRSLWGDGAALAGTSLAALIDRLAARLGAAHVVRPRRQAEYQPESAWRSVPLVGPAPGAAARTEPRRVLAEPGASGFERPLELLSPPEPLEAIAVAGAGPPGAIQTPHRRRTVRRTWGPERIETGWWRGPLVRRDYWRIEIDSGQWWWVFRDLDDGRWYLHGVFE